MIIKLFLLALSFLTIIPVPSLGACSSDDIRKSMCFFPLVGFLIGIILVFTDIILEPFYSPPLRNALVTLALFLVTGGIHHDGLADVADAFYGNRSKGEILRIMKDSTLGTMGVLALIFSVLLFWLLLNELDGAEKLWALVCAPVIGRSVQVILVEKIPYAREGGGTGALFFGGSIPMRFYTAVFSIFLFFAAFSLVSGIINTFLVLVASFLWGKYIMKKIGGVTGDCLGAANEVAQILTLFLFVANK